MVLDKRTVTCVHHDGTLPRLTALGSPVPPHSLPANPLAAARPFTLPIALSFPECRPDRTLPSVTFSAWPLSPSDTHLRFLCAFSGLEGSFLFGAESRSVVWVDHGVFIRHLLENITVAPLPSFGDHKYSCCKQPCAGFCADVSFQLLCIHTKEHKGWMVCQEWV